jgi:hypothetical protein
MEWYLVLVVRLQLLFCLRFSDGLLGLLSLCSARLFLLSSCCVGIVLIVFFSASASLFEIDRCIIPIEQKH